MTQAQNNKAVESNTNSDEIDLIDLVMQLWKGKATIIASVVVVLILAIIYLFVAKEKWTSTAIVTTPDAAQVATYTRSLKTLYPDAGVSPGDIQHRVVFRYAIALSALSNTLSNQDVPETLTVEPVTKGQGLPLQVTYSAESAELAQQKLTQYLQQINEQVANELDSDLSNGIKPQVTILSTKLENQETVAKSQRDLRLQQIREALKYAEKANITKPQVQQTQDVTQDTLFLLGSDGLKAMVEYEQTRPLSLSGSYYQTKNELLDIQKLDFDPKTLQSYRYVMEPDLPIHRDSPKRAIILVLAVLLGGMIGVGVVLGRNALRNYQRQNNA